MRYRFIVFRAQPKGDTIAFSIYLEDVVSVQGTCANVVPVLDTSPSDEYALDIQFTSPFSAPTTSGASGSGSAQRGTDTNCGLPANSRVCRNIDRTWDQCEWLHQKIGNSFRLQVLPPLPERPNRRKLGDTLYIERCRARIERWLNRLGAREDICQSASMEHFISSKMSSSEVGGSAKQGFSSLLLNLFGGGSASTDNGFKTYTPISEIADYDEDKEERRREYISSIEECAQELSAAMSAAHAQDEVFGRSVVKAALAVGKAYRVDSLLPRTEQSDVTCAPLDNSSADQEGPSYSSVDHQRLDVSLALLHNSAEAYYWSTKELGVWREYNVADVVMEYVAMTSGIKEVTNHATHTLMLYEKTMLRHRAREQQANDLRVQYPSDTPSVKYANEQEAQSEREMDMAHQEYTDANDVASSELVRFERERASGICKALENMATVELDAARARCQELRALCRRIRSMQMIRDPPHPRTNIGPILWHAADALLPTPSSSRSSSMGALPNDRSKTSSSFSAHTMYRYSASSVGASSSSAYTRKSHTISAAKAASFSLNGTSDRGIRRVRTMDNAEFDSWSGSGSSAAQPSSNSAHNHSVFEGADEHEVDDSPLPSPTSVPAHASGSGTADQQPLRQKKRWNGRISTMPFQGYEAKADPKSRVTVDQSRLEEIAVEAEMEAELVRSGMLAARKVSRKRSVPNYTSRHGPVSANALHPPPVLPAFLPNRRDGGSSRQLRYANSCTSLSTIPQPVSPSEYLQYSRQTLNSSLSKASPLGSGAASTSSGSGSRPTLSHAAQRSRDIKGKGYAFAV
ncbi:hypothetical protein H4R20_001166 [Coemansia guatemalensis]|uniref:PX domain-containing protein n=1 Tax=Coemansia guatemalensis TaxID=2761395 RepID=A0A9W8HZW4_9FUNG|nr:hypothetical protein H4R20_001166 [Coemansia guatemalensis]